MNIQITDTFRIAVDTLGNHQPEYFKEGGELMTKGIGAGKVSKDKWISSGKFYNNPAWAIRWGIENGYLESSSILDGSDMTAGEYLGVLKMHYDEMTRLCKTFGSK